MRDIDIVWDNIKIEVTGEDGQSISMRQYILPLLSSELSHVVRSFDIGEDLEDCVTNFDKGGETNCDSSEVDAYSAADFYLTVPQDWN